ncbi:unnamed protein product, partial [Hapterophycus canaliculatus]
MLALGFLLLSQLQATLSLIQPSITRPSFWRPGSRMPSHKPLQVAPEPSADIEELPASLVKDYQQHQAATYHTFTIEELVEIRRGLLSWYDKNRRMLPWRGDAPPWTRQVIPRTTSSSASSASGTVTRREDGKADVHDATQPRLTAFFGTTPKRAADRAPAKSKNKGNENSDYGTGDNGAGARKRKKTEEANDKADGANESVKTTAEEQQEGPLERIPMSAYGTWVSEVMLQQTRVETVVDYFVKWMKLFPTPKALAEADLEQVNKAWAGLGYYRRAKMLHLGAKKVMADHGGSLPSTAKELKDLPGIGPYTAG